MTERDDNFWNEPYDPRAVDRFAQLPPATKEFLTKLDEGDIKDLNESMQFMHQAKMAGRIFRWVWVTIAAAFFGVIALTEGIQKVIQWIGHGISR